MRKILSNIKKADLDHQLIEDGDIIALGISGGKDSLLLLEAMKYYKRYSQKDFKMIAIHIKMGFPDMDTSKVADFAKSHGIDFYQYEFDIYKILKIHAKGDKIDCSLCSTLKKGAVIRYAKEHGCNKISFAHHLDDALETIFLNMIYGASISTFAPKSYLSREDVTFIRPLFYVKESQIISYATKQNYQVLASTCPNNFTSKRADIKRLIQEINSQFPASKSNFTTMIRSNKFRLWK